MITPTSNKRSRSGKKKAEVELEVHPEIEKFFETVEIKIDDVKKMVLGHLGS